MLGRFYITPGQWRRIFRWVLYGLLFLGTLLLQTVLLGKDGVFGQHPDLVAVVIISVAVAEGPERGGLFALIASTFWALSGIERGALQILCLTAVPVLCSYFSGKLFSASYMTSLITCGLTLLVAQTLNFLFMQFYEAVPGYFYMTRLLPGILVALLFQPLIYWLVKSIGKIGDPYEAT